MINSNNFKSKAIDTLQNVVESKSYENGHKIFVKYSNGSQFGLYENGNKRYFINSDGNEYGWHENGYRSLVKLKRESGYLFMKFNEKGKNTITVRIDSEDKVKKFLFYDKDLKDRLRLFTGKQKTDENYKPTKFMTDLKNGIPRKKFTYLAKSIGMGDYDEFIKGIRDIIKNTKIISHGSIIGCTGKSYNFRTFRPYGFLIKLVEGSIDKIFEEDVYSPSYGLEGDDYLEKIRNFETEDTQVGLKEAIDSDDYNEIHFTGREENKIVGVFSDHTHGLSNLHIQFLNDIKNSDMNIPMLNILDISNDYNYKDVQILFNTTADELLEIMKKYKNKWIINNTKTS